MGEVGGWELGKKDITRFGKDPVEGEEEGEELDVWVGFSNQKSRDEAIELRKMVEGLVESVEIP